MGVSGGIVMTYTNATDIQDLTGISYSYGLTLVPSLGVSVDYIEFNPSSNPNKTCRGISIVIAFGGGGDFHATENITESTRSWNPFLELRKTFFGK